MSVNSTGRGCRRRGHPGDAAHRMAIYDSLPREIRDKIKIARNNLCVACVRNDLRWNQRRFGELGGLERTASMLDMERRISFLEEDLRP